MKNESPLHGGRGLDSNTGLVVDCTSDDVEKFARDGLLAALVVLQVELTKQFVGVVGCSLHGHHAGGML